MIHSNIMDYPLGSFPRFGHQERWANERRERAIANSIATRQAMAARNLLWWSVLSVASACLPADATAMSFFSELKLPGVMAQMRPLKPNAPVLLKVADFTVQLRTLGHSAVTFNFTKR